MLIISSYLTVLSIYLFIYLSINSFAHIHSYFYTNLIYVFIFIGLFFELHISIHIYPSIYLSPPNHNESAQGHMKKMTGRGPKNRDIDQALYTWYCEREDTYTVSYTHTNQKQIDRQRQIDRQIYSQIDRQIDGLRGRKTFLAIYVSSKLALNLHKNCTFELIYMCIKHLNNAQNIAIAT